MASPLPQIILQLNQIFSFKLNNAILFYCGNSSCFKLKVNRFWNERVENGLIEIICCFLYLFLLELFLKFNLHLQIVSDMCIFQWQRFGLFSLSNSPVYEVVYSSVSKGTQKEGHAKNMPLRYHPAKYEGTGKAFTFPSHNLFHLTIVSSRLHIPV